MGARVSLALFAAMSFVGSAIVIVGSLTGWHPVGLVFGFILGALGFVWLGGNLFTFSCPENTVYLAVNTLNKEMYVVSRGFWFRFPWDKIDDSNKFLLDLRQTEVKGAPGETKDGAQVKIDVIVAWKPDVRSADALTAFNALGSPKEAQQKVDNAISTAIKRQINLLAPMFDLDEIKGILNGPGNGDRSLRERIKRDLGISDDPAVVSDLERKFGIDIQDVDVGDATPTDASQKIRDLRLKFRTYIKEAMRMKDELNMDPKMALEMLLSADPDSNALKLMGKGFVFPPAGGI